MDPSDLQPSPRRELLGPRPSPLKIGKDSHKIRKPPIAPPRHHHPPAANPPPERPRNPVIIYTVSPKIIHINPSEFMTLVQRLTGPNSSAALLPPLPPSLPPSGAISPAARIASFERSAASSSSPRAKDARAQPGDSDQWEIGGVSTLDWTASFPGILSPIPSSLPPISPALFTPPAFDPSVISFLHELSPIFANNFNGNIIGNSPIPNLLATPTMPSPGAFWDLMCQFPDM